MHDDALVIVTKIILNGIFLIDSSPAAIVECDGVDGLVDRKGSPQEIYEFAGEADIVVTCLTLYPETVSFLFLFFVCFLHFYRSFNF